MRSTGWLVVAILAALGIALFVWEGGSVVSSTAPGVGDGQEQDAATPGAERREPADAAPVDASRAGSRRAVAQKFDGPMLDAAVVELGSGNPVPGATVRFRPPDFDWRAFGESEREELRAVADRDPEEWFRRIGGVVTADAEGRCQVPAGDQNVEVVARAGELFGRAWLRRDSDEPQRIVVSADRTLRVRVVDHAGEPAAGVAVRTLRHGADGQRMRSELGKTDTEGRIERRHVQTQANAGHGTDLELTAAVPGGASEPAVIDVTAPPDEVVLRLPPTGSVAVRFVEADGQPVDLRYLEHRRIRMAAFDEPPAQQSEVVDAFNRAAFTAEMDERASVRFEHVALGCFLVACHHVFTETARFAGPVGFGQHVEAEIRRDAGQVVFVGRVLGVAGEPLRGERLELQYRRDHSMGSMNGRTDNDGRFRIPMTRHPIGEGVTLTVGTRPRAGGKRRAVALPPREVTAGTDDLGDLVLPAPRVLVQGRLLIDGGSEGIDFGRHVQMDVWRLVGSGLTQEYNLRPDIAADGSFELRGPFPDETRLQLRVRAASFLPVEPVECTVGTTDLEIVLRRGGELTAVFVADDADLARALEYRLREADAIEPRSWQELRRAFFSGSRLEAVDDGRLRRTWSGLDPGTYRLSVHAPASAEALAAIDDLVVSAGPCTDPRLASIDLRGLLSTLEVRAVGADGRPIANRDAAVIVSGDGRSWRGYNLGEGVVRLVVDGPTDVQVVAPGHRIARLDGLREDRIIALERAPELTARVDTPLRLPDGVDLFVVLRGQTGDRADMISLDAGRSMPLNAFLAETARVEKGIARLSPRWPGPFRVVAEVGRGRPDRTIRAIEPRSLGADAVQSDGVIDVRIDAEALREAIEKLR